MLQDLTHKQKTLIPIWEAALACVAAADAARAGLEAARFTIQMTWRAFQFAALTSVDQDWPCGRIYVGGLPVGRAVLGSNGYITGHDQFRET